MHSPLIFAWPKPDAFTAIVLGVIGFCMALYAIIFVGIYIVKMFKDLSNGSKPIPLSVVVRLQIYHFKSGYFWRKIRSLGQKFRLSALNRIRLRIIVPNMWSRLRQQDLARRITAADFFDSRHAGQAKVYLMMRAKQQAKITKMEMKYQHLHDKLNFLKEREEVNYFEIVRLRAECEKVLTKLRSISVPAAYRLQLLLPEDD